MESGVSHINAPTYSSYEVSSRASHGHRSSGSKDLLSGLGEVDLLGSVIAVHEGELLLVIQRGGSEVTPTSSRTSSRAPSRPCKHNRRCREHRRVERTPSIRVKTGPLDRKPSVARRNSLPSISQRPTCFDVGVFV
jgi:hypothetical protein